MKSKAFEYHTDIVDVFNGAKISFVLLLKAQPRGSTSGFSLRSAQQRGEVLPAGNLSPLATQNLPAKHLLFSVAPSPRSRDHILQNGVAGGSIQSRCGNELTFCSYSIPVSVVVT